MFTVILSNATPRGGAYSWKELGSARQGTVEAVYR